MKGAEAERGSTNPSAVKASYQEDICLLSWLLLSLPRSTLYPILPNLWFPSTGTAPALSLQPLGPHAILEADDSYPPMPYLSTNTVLEKYKSVPPGIGFCCNQLLLPKESKENRTGQTG